MYQLFLPLLIVMSLTTREGSSPASASTSLPEVVAQVADDIESADSLSAGEPMLLPFEGLIQEESKLHHVPATLIAAVIQEESRFDAWAERVEVGYTRNPRIKHEARRWAAAHGNTPSVATELADRSRSMGLMQVMGEVAREQQFDARYLSGLFEPANSINQGATLLRKLLDRYPKDTLAAISAYNQGFARKRHASRRRAAAFLNARYVYRVMIAWRTYEKLFEMTRRVQHE
jgi:soluble lytic murein transglycosylase-like protein